MILRDMCPDCQHPNSVHGHGGEGENAYPVCPPEIRDEMAEVIESAVDEDLPADPTRAELQAACMRAADAILPIIEREKADAWDEGFRAGDGYGTSCTETHAGYRDSLPIRPANPYRGEGE